MMEKVYQTGNTVRLQCTFTDFDGNVINPDIVKIIFYDHKYTKVLEQSLYEANRVDEGTYKYDYITPSTEQRIYYEWYGEIAGKPAIQRDGFRTAFLN